MRRSKSIAGIGMLAAVVLGVAGLATAEPIGTAFSYQGHLRDGGIPVSGDYDMWFTLFDAASGGAAVAGPLYFDGGGGNAPPVEVVNGVFQVDLDFGDEFDGTALWLQVEVRPHGGGAMMPLTPRQALTPAPFAMHSLGDSWTNENGHIHNNNAGNVGIGTATPEYALDVVGRSQVRQSPGGSSAGVWFHQAVPDEERGFVGMRNDNQLGLWGNEGAGWGLLMDVASGFVGLGTASPQDRLHVNGGVTANGALTSTSPPGDSVVYLGWGTDPSGADMARIRIGGNGVGANNGLDIQRVNNVSLMRLLNNGDVSFRGEIDFDMQIVTDTANVGPFGEVACPAGKRAISGGCACGCSTNDQTALCFPDAQLIGSAPRTDGLGWSCACSGASGTSVHSWAICARVR